LVLHRILLILILETTFGQPPNIGTISDGNNYIRQGFQQPLYNFISTPGCTDPTALNYDPNATIDDGSCVQQLIMESNWTRHRRTN
jgi:hypothetical protein